MNLFNFFRKAKSPEVGGLPAIIFNEMMFISSKCVNEYILGDRCDEKDICRLGENVSMIFMALILVYLEEFQMVELKKSVIDQYKTFLKQIGEHKSYKRALQKVQEIRSFIHPNPVSTNFNEKKECWEVRIRTLIWKFSEAKDGEIMAFFAPSFDDMKITRALLDHVDKTKNLILAAKDHN